MPWKYGFPRRSGSCCDKRNAPAGERRGTTYGVRYSVSGLTDLLHRLGFSYKLTTAVPCQADAARQRAFLTDTLTPLLAVAEAGEAVVYFANAATPPASPTCGPKPVRSGPCSPSAGTHASTSTPRSMPNEKWPLTAPCLTLWAQGWGVQATLRSTYS